MKYYFKRSLFFFTTILILNFNACSERITSDDTGGGDNLFSPYGVDSLVEIVNWNVLYSGSSTFPTEKEDKLAEIIKAMDVDIIAVEEFPSEAEMTRLIAKTDGYSGIVNPDADGFNQNTGYIYKNATVTLESSKPIYTSDSYAFPRSPFTADFTVQNSSGSFTIHLVNVHLKALSGSSNDARRKDANEKLESYVNDYITNNPDRNVIVLGDFNDTIDDTSVFGSWYAYPDEFVIATSAIAVDPSQASYPSFPSFIDHQIFTTSLVNTKEYKSGSTQTLLLDHKVENYFSISDHRPVMSVFRYEK